MNEERSTEEQDATASGHAEVIRPPLHIFCDFDGTISTVDIGFDLFDRFGRQEPWHGRLLAGELSTAEYWRIMAANLRSPLTPELLDHYLASIPIDPGAHDLVATARAEAIPFTIVSDGFDIYIRRFLALYGLADLDLYSNHAEMMPDGRLDVAFPYAAEGCECVSAACKRNILLRTVRPDARIIYIGDGVSDFCPSEHADVIFAKKRLAAHCNARRLPHYPFKTLSDVAAQIRTLAAKKRIRPRHQAELRRKGVWEEEN